jgi:hypothetical protein
MDRDFILESIGDLRGEDLANSLAEHAKDVSWVESEDRNIPQFGGGPARGIYQYEIKGTKDGSGASETALNRFYNYISKNNLSIPLEYEDELKNLSDKNNPDFTELSPELQSQIFYADKALGTIPLDKLADGSLSSRDAWVKYHQAGSEKERPNKEEQFDRAMRTRPATLDAQTDQMLSEEQPGSTFRPEDDTVPSDTGTVTGDQVEEEPGFLDTVGEYVGDAYDTASEYVSETVDTLEGVAESVGDKLRRLLGSEEEQQSSSSNDNPPLPTPRPDQTDTPPLPTPRPDQTDTPPLPTPRPGRTEDAFSAVEDFVNTLKKAEGGSVEKKAEFIKKDDDDDVPDPPPGATPEEVADDIPAYLSTGEYVLPANVVRYIGLKNITGMHQRALSELQQMEDLDIIENVDENGYVEEDDDEMDYMKPEGVVEIVVAEHHPKGLLAMGFADGGLVEAMVYVPGVGFVPQIQAAARSSQKKTDEDTRAETREGPSGRGGTDTGKSMSEMSPMEQAAFGGALSGPLGGAIEAVSKGVVGGALGLASPMGVEMGYSLATGVPTAAQQAMKSVDLDIAKAKEMYAMSAADLAQAQVDFSGPIGNPFGATQNQMDRHADAVGRGTAPAGSHANAAGGYSTKGEFGFSTNEDGDVVGNDPDRNGVPGDQTNATMSEEEAGFESTGKSGTSGTSEAAAAEAEAEAAAAEAEAAGAKKGGYVTRNGIMARGYSEGGMINSDSSFEEGQVLPTSDIFSEGVYAQVNIDRSVDSENVVESDKVITAPIAFSMLLVKLLISRTLHRKKPPPYAKQSRGLVPKVMVWKYLTVNISI